MDPSLFVVPLQLLFQMSLILPILCRQNVQSDPPMTCSQHNPTQIFASTGVGPWTSRYFGRLHMVFSWHNSWCPPHENLHPWATKDFWCLFYIFITQTQTCGPWNGAPLWPRPSFLCDTRRMVKNTPYRKTTCGGNHRCLRQRWKGTWTLWPSLGCVSHKLPLFCVVVRVRAYDSHTLDNPLCPVCLILNAQERKCSLTLFIPMPWGVKYLKIRSLLMAFSTQQHPQYPWNECHPLDFLQSKMTWLAIGHAHILVSGSKIMWLHSSIHSPRW